MRFGYGNPTRKHERANVHNFDEYELHGVKLYATALVVARSVRVPGMCIEDQVQAGAIHLLQQFDKFDSTRGKATTFAYRVLRNHYIKKIEARRCKKRPDSKTTSFSELRRRLNKRQENDGLDFMSYEDRAQCELLDLRYYSRFLEPRRAEAYEIFMRGVTTREAGKIMGCSQTIAHDWFVKAKNTLSEMMVA